MATDESIELERLTYLILSKVGPHILVRYNVLRDLSIGKNSRLSGNSVEYRNKVWSRAERRKSREKYKE
jgi:hypothetical protein